MSIQFTGSAIPPDGTVTAPKINSGSSTVGFVLTADGVGGADFDELPAAGGGLLASGATVGATAQRQIFTSGVGVGASPPAAMLGVIGADSLNTSFAGNISGATGTGLVITNAGNVGIGTTIPTAALHLPASSTARASLRIPAGTAPTTPNAGDVWVAGTVIKFYDGTTTKEIAFV